jgi:hypothetical protein
MLVVNILSLLLVKETLKIGELPMHHGVELPTVCG